MNVEIGTEAEQFLFWEYLFHIFGIVSLQCDPAVKVPPITNPGVQNMIMIVPSNELSKRRVVQLAVFMLNEKTTQI
jgi:hypothetical protein